MNQQAEGHPWRMQIGPVGDAGGLSLQWWRDGARVINPGKRATREARRTRGLNVGADAPFVPIGSATLASEARSALVMVGEKGPGEGSARRAVKAKAARATGARHLVRVVIDEVTGEVKCLPAPERGGADIDFDSPLFEGVREAARGVFEPADFVESWLLNLWLHPVQPLPGLSSPGAVARAVRDTAGMRKGRIPRTLPSESSVHDARDAACAEVGVWLARFVTEKDASEEAARALRDAGIDAQPGYDALRFWLWLMAYRVARRTLRAWRWGTKRDTSPGERAPVVIGGDEGEAKLATLRADADTWIEKRSKRERALAMRVIRRAVAHLGDDRATATARARTRDGVRAILRVLARVVVQETSLVDACAMERTTLDAVCQRADRLGFWRALNDWQRSQRMAESRPLAWLGGASIRLRQARAGVPSWLPEPVTGPFNLPRADTRPKATLAHRQGLLVHPSVGSIANPDNRQGTRARNERRARGMRALAALIQAREEVSLYSRQAARDLKARGNAWRTVSRSWRNPGKVSGKRTRKAKV